MSTIEQKTIIEAGAIIGEGTIIKANCFIGKNVIIGKNNTIASNVVIDGNTVIGDNNNICAYTVLGTEAQDTKTTSDKVGLSIGNENQIDSFVFITAGTDHGGLMTRIEDRNSFMKGIHIGHDVQIGSNCVMEENAALGGHVIIGDYVVLEKEASVHQFVEIGTHAKLKENSALTQDLPPYCVAENCIEEKNRAKITGINQETLGNNYPANKVQNIKKAYDLIFKYGSPKDNAIKALEEECTLECSILYNFIVKSKRGIPFQRNKDVN